MQRVRSSGPGRQTKLNLPSFASEALADFRTIGAIAPSSRYLTKAMLRPLPLKTAQLVVELGSGTGVITEALLKSLPSEATLLGFEINRRFSQHLRFTVCDRRFVLINDRAETLQSEVHRRGFKHIDAVVSSLALGLMSNDQRHSFLSGVRDLLGRTGVFTQYQYLHCMQLNDGQLKKFDLTSLLQRYFGSVQRTIIWRNLPPAFVLTCRRALPRAKSFYEAGASDEHETRRSGFADTSRILRL